MESFYLLQHHVNTYIFKDCFEQMSILDNNTNSFADYLYILEHNPQEYDKLLDTITINVSEFFRNRETFNAVSRIVIPAIIKRKRRLASHILRVWSAGCATGEEPYSLAIMFNELFVKKLADLTTTIYATDIDEKVIEKAKRGEYEAGAVSEVDERILKRYFKHNLKYELKEGIKQMVRFKHHDLISDNPPGHLDIILCRNVLIYFSRDLQMRLFDKFCEALNRGGYLILGKTESLAGESAGLFQPVSNRERIYKKG